jgi:hypothetical protein
MPGRRMGGGAGRLSGLSTRMSCGPLSLVFSFEPSCGPTGPTTDGRVGTFMTGRAPEVSVRLGGGGGGAMMMRRAGADGGSGGFGCVD